MNRGIVSAVLATCLLAPIGAQAEVLNEAKGAVSRADGVIDLAIGAPASADLAELLEALAASPARQVRLSVSEAVPDREGLLSRLEETATDRPGWLVCSEWFTDQLPGGTESADYLSANLGGALLFIDNGAPTDVFDNPESDIVAAIENDPAFAGLGVEGGEAFRITDFETYDRGAFYLMANLNWVGGDRPDGC